MNNKLKSLLPTLGVILFFIAVSCVYFSPVLHGKMLSQSDNIQVAGMAQEAANYEKETGEHAQWTNSMFGGMPAFQIKGDSSTNLFWYLNRVSRLGLPYTTIAIVFLYLLGFFMLLRSMGFNLWLSAGGAVAFGFGSFNFLIILAGHVTQAYAIALMAPVLAGVIYAYNKNMWAGALITVVALGAEIACNHIQITYYLALLVAILVIDRLVRAVKQKTVPDFGKRSGLLVVALVLAVLPNLTSLWTTYEYGKYTMRGTSELREADNMRNANANNDASVKAQNSSGLEANYAFAWSYGKMETFTFLVPNLMGGGSKAIADNPDAMKNVDSRLAEVVGGQSQYWGSKPFTEGPFYAGAIICFLFVLAMFFYQEKEKWWLLAGTVLSMLLSWGHNLEWFNMFMFNYFPLYNKFRVVEMTLVIATVTIPLLAMLGLKAVIDNPVIVKQKANWFLAALGITGGIALLFYLVPDVFFSFISDNELDAITLQQAKEPAMAAQYDMLMQELAVARRSILKADALRSLIFILLGSGSLWFYVSGKLAAKYIVPGLIALTLIDLWGVDRRYISNDKFMPARQAHQFTKSKADEAILKDQDPSYRVFAIYGNPFNESATSYYHHSIGGYHGAKLQIYQDVIDGYLQNDWQTIRGMLSQGTRPDEMEHVFAQLPVTNMLNARYIIYNPNADPIRNPHAMGNAWFVQNVRYANDAREELDVLGIENLRETAVIHSAFANVLQDVTIGSEGGSIELTEYTPNRITYRANTGSPQIAVFSEIYYPAGWDAYINGVKTPIFRANYLLRGLAVPQGESTIEFRFEPVSYRYGKILSAAGSIVALLIIAAYAAVAYRKRKMVNVDSN
ncbi:MAG: YfhO family protein [Cytophagaceae bacterium]|jgi:hypothetical protein|nr:YfhO family protein [Cytophagaceae bacterium]